MIITTRNERTMDGERERVTGGCEQDGKEKAVEVPTAEYDAPVLLFFPPRVDEPAPAGYNNTQKIKETL